MSIRDELRLLVKIANLYYIDKMKQSDIARKLNLSQSFVSRALARSLSEGIVKINIVQPAEVFLNLENRLQEKFSLDQVVIVDIDETNDSATIKKAIGSAAAYYLQTTIRDNELIGLSAWSDTIKAMTEQLPKQAIKAKGVVQLLGGVGINGSVQANFMTHELADKLNCQPFLLPAQSLTGTMNYKNELFSSNEIASVVSQFKDIDVALIGIGMLEPSLLLKNSGLYYKEEMLGFLASKGAVGDICLHYYDQNGVPILSENEDPIIGMPLNLVKECPRVVALAGGKEKVGAILGALKGGYIDVLITDKFVAAKLLNED
ncbi:DNA-binding transcriptional regulator [Chelonobacter oris]|uniref:DeoR faimly transcriptional regulator n=1 Tax=Chelonobacter oris TaxID=505317 RepID=A0A0A3ATQ3_9PAST|nr:sugar-binding transcriptional regulator [Chelonobacter oris]KGQ70465.1 DeoR faimly transcriptional regulator [Chelonobacter oris]MDH3000504.1 DNA-binding transcriptional regulator [Chelonobacter oris]